MRPHLPLVLVPALLGVFSISVLMGEHHLKAQNLRTAANQGTANVLSEEERTTANALITFSSASSNYTAIGSNTLTISSGGTIVIDYDDYAPPPANAQWHTVTDTYYDSDGKTVKTLVSAHHVDPLYCHPGHRPDESRIVHAPAMPKTIVEMIAAAAPDDPHPPTVIPETGKTKLADTQ